MPSRVLLISANRYEVPYPVFPIGLSHVHAALRSAGHATRWFDCLADSEPLESALDDFEPEVVGISIRNIDDVAFRKRETFHASAIDLCTRIRACSSARIVLGGSGFSIFPQALLTRSGADFGIQGEGEASLVSLLAALEAGTDPSAIPGLVFRDAAGVVRANPQRPGRTSWPLDAEDRPQRLVDYYLARSSMLNVQTQRGCAFECCYCTYPLIEGARLRRRPPEVVAEDLASLAARGARYVSLVDSVFNSTPTHVVETCEAILRRGVEIKWGCFLRPRDLTAEQMDLMARAGLAHVEFGSDSFSDRVLRTYGKSFSFADIKRSAELTHAARIEQCHFLILGGVGETPETMEETLAANLGVAGAVVLPVTGMRVYPGTELFEQAVREGAVAREADLLEPFHYLAPGLTADAIAARLAEHVRTHPHWIVGDPPATFGKLVERLRLRGVLGPLWTYFALIQRLPSVPHAAR